MLKFHAKSRKEDHGEPLEGLEEFTFAEQRRPDQDAIIAGMCKHRLLSVKEEVALGTQLLSIRQQVRTEVSRQPLVITFMLSDEWNRKNKNLSDLQRSLGLLQARWHELRSGDAFLPEWQAEVSRHSEVISRHLRKMSGKKGVSPPLLPLESDYRFPRLMSLWRSHVAEFEGLFSVRGAEALASVRDLEDAVLMPAGEFLAAYRRILEMGLQYASVREQFARCNMRLVPFFARRFTPAGGDYLDRITPAALGLYRAIDRFDPSRGTRFATFAAHQIRASIQRDDLQGGQVIRLPGNVAIQSATLLKKSREMFPQSPSALQSLREAGRALGWRPKKIERILKGVQARKVKIVGGCGNDGDEASKKSTHILDSSLTARERSLSDEPSTVLRMSEDHAILKRALVNLLRDREIYVLERRYGLYTGRESPSEPAGLKEVGNEIGITRERVRQIQREAEIILKSVQVLLAAAPQKLKAAIEAIGVIGDKEALADVLQAKASGRMEVSKEAARDLVKRLASLLIFQNGEPSLMTDLAFRKLSYGDCRLLLTLPSNGDDNRLDGESARYVGEALKELQKSYTGEHYRSTILALERDNAHGKSMPEPLSPEI